MSKSITEQIEDLQKENKRLQGYEKIFEKALKNKFGIGHKTIRKNFAETVERTQDFEHKICSFFDLKTEDDKAAFIAAICSDTSLRFFYGKRESITASE